MTDFDLLFSRLRGLAWSHVAMAGACFVFATALFVSPAWGYADFARLQQLLSWFGIVAGSLSLVAAFAMRAGWTLHGVEPAVGLVLLLGGLWTLTSRSPSTRSSRSLRSWACSWHFICLPRLSRCIVARLAVRACRLPSPLV